MRRNQAIKISPKGRRFLRKLQKLCQDENVFIEADNVKLLSKRVDDKGEVWTDFLTHQLDVDIQVEESSFKREPYRIHVWYGKKVGPDNCWIPKGLK